MPAQAGIQSPVRERGIPPPWVRAYAGTSGS